MKKIIFILIAIIITTGIVYGQLKNDGYVSVNLYQKIISEFTAKNANGLSSVQKVSGKYYLVTKKFNSETGAELSPNSTEIDTLYLKKVIQNYQNEINSINTILNYIRNLP